MLTQAVSTLDFIDGLFNLIGMLCFIGAGILISILYFKNKSLTSLIMLIVIVSGGLYAFGVVLDNWTIWDEETAKSFVESFVCCLC